MKTRMSDDETFKHATHLQKWFRMNILFVVKVKILVLIKRSYSPHRQLCSLVSLEWLSYSERVVQSSETHVFLVYVLGNTLNHIA